MGWMIAVLSAMLVGTISVRWADLSQIQNIISIALGLSSLLLAIVAIIQAVSSGNTLTLSLGKIESAAERALRATEAVDSSAQILASKSSIFEQIHPSLTAIQERIDELSAVNSTKADPKQHTSSSPKIGEGEIFAEGTTGSNVALYFAQKSFESGKSFDSIEVLPDQRYICGIVAGYLLALRASGIIKMHYNSGNMLVTDMGPFSSSEVDRHFIESTSANTLSDLKEKIDAYFKG